MNLNLLVLRTRKMDELGDFYKALGLEFVRERHGQGPHHLACTREGTTFEIYPCIEGGDTQGMRIGFRVDDTMQQFEQALSNGAEPVKRPHSSDWGTRAVFRDPGGHIVELLSDKLQASA